MARYYVRYGQGLPACIALFHEQRFQHALFLDKASITPMSDVIGTSVTPQMGMALGKQADPARSLPLLSACSHTILQSSGSRGTPASSLGHRACTSDRRKVPASVDLQKAEGGDMPYRIWWFQPQSSSDHCMHEMHAVVHVPTLRLASLNVLQRP